MDNDSRWLGGWDDRNTFSIPTGQWPWEIETVYPLVKALKPRRILEIGSLYGGTLVYWLKCLTKGDDTNVVAIDPEIDKVRDYLSDPRLVLVNSSSHNESAINKALSYAPFDALFIDGDHSYEGAKRDFDTYGDMVREGGLILLHDIATFRPEVGVPKLWEFIKIKHKVKEYIGKHTIDIPGGGIGVVYK